MNIHEQSINSNTQKRYVCDFENCNFACKWPSFLANHKLIHENKRNFKCDICDATFKLSGDLLRHKRYHENIRNHLIYFNDVLF